ncbi:ATP-binding protein [Streptomyces sp. NPDC048419]|uniref:ATP-binding protein n=1 Tax=Streptomyces sp. NPDC048419 TaxID=3365547 RepID=UPI003714A28A
MAGADDAAERLPAELARLYAAAGSPPQAALVQRCGARLGRQVSLSTVNPWLRGHNLPALSSWPVLRVLVEVLQQMAAERGTAFDRRTEGSWSALLRSAHDQLAAGKRGGRPRKKPPRAPDSSGNPRIPHSLPADVVDFTGRDAEVRELLGLLEPDTPTDVVLVAAGMAGAGKTALAVHVAHRVHREGRFPGGVLFVDLHGFSPDAPLDAADTAAILLRALGCRTVPSSATERAAALHSLLAGRPPVLIVLDNAASAQQLTGLTPHPPHRLLVTSRITLSALPSARRVPLDSLSAQESTTLLDRALRRADADDERVTKEPDAARRIAELCGFLPLALRITAAQLRDDLHHLLADQADALTHVHDRLGLLSYDDVDAEGRPLAVRAAFDLSFARLLDAHRRAFRLLGALPGPDIGQETAAVALDRGAHDTYRLLADLARRHLLRRRPDGRWDMHDLLRLYAGEQATREEYDAALDRMLHHYRRRVPAACRRLSRDTGRSKDRREAVEWLDAEHGSVAEAVVAAGERTRRREAVQLAADMATFWEFRRHSREWIAAAEAALRAARHLGASDLCAASSNLGNAYRVNHQPDEALPHLERAALLAPNEAARGKVLHNLGLVHFQLGRYGDAASQHQTDLDICRSRGDALGAAQALAALGDAQRMLDQHADAAATLQTALSLLDAHPRPAEGMGTGAFTDTRLRAHMNLGLTLMRWNASDYGRCGIWHLCHALRIALERDNREAQLKALTNLAALYLTICPDCHAPSAIDCATRALTLSEHGADPVVAAGAQLILSQADMALGNEAAGCHPTADTADTAAQQRPLHASVLEGDYEELERTTFYGFRYAVWS